MSIIEILKQIREEAITEHEKGYRFEVLIKNWLLSDPRYAEIKQVWLWHEFPARDDFGGKDLGIDLVAYTDTGEYWAIQCKFYKEGSTIAKGALDSFIANSSRIFKDPKNNNLNVRFTQRLWVSTLEGLTGNAEEIVQNQEIPFVRISLETLCDAQVDWEAVANGTKSSRQKKGLYPHQKEALEKAHAYYKNHDRGQLIMACGTGKTFTALALMEQELKEKDTNIVKGTVLFLVPSISLLNQTLNAWMSDTICKIHPICVCSDANASKIRSKNTDNFLESAMDVPIGASTNPDSVLKEYKKYKDKDDGLIVIFSTYQSIDVVSKAQKHAGGTEKFVFDWIICDEAHRTTGMKFAGKDESEFTKVHSDSNIHGVKRLYMTATPKLYGDNAKGKAKEADVLLCSMDSKETYGEEFYRVGFGYAVQHGLLTEYKVIVFVVDSEEQLPESLQKRLSDNGDDISFEQLSKLYGCVMSLSKQCIDDDSLWNDDPKLMKKAIVFCSTIGKEGDLNSSVYTTEQLKSVSNSIRKDADADLRKFIVQTDTRHIDGGMDSNKRAGIINWLAEENTNETECRALCNVRCLSEGIDVPSLDAIIFLAPRSSQIEIVQSVGRVMRRGGEAKKYGYIILPVVISLNAKPDEVLDKNENFQTVWQVLRALRSHDERFSAEINSLSFQKDPAGGSSPNNRIHVVFDEFGHRVGETEEEKNQRKLIKKRVEQQLMLLEDYKQAIYAKMVEKVGDRMYWEKWAKDVGAVAQNLIGRITEKVNTEGEHQEVFNTFLAGLRENINNSISQEQAIEMLGQHFIAKPVFDALFSEYKFAENNPVSKSMETMLDTLSKAGMQKDTAVLEKFYNSVKYNLGNIDNLEGKQQIIKNLYEKFFKGAFPKAVEQLGIVYTPVECVDFIIRSVNDLLIAEFGKSLSDEGVHILDPFTGTGTFITRLFQTGVITPEDMKRKYLQEIHCNEIVLLAYYVADVNIESVFHEVMKPEEYTKYSGICLTDTFNLNESNVENKKYGVAIEQALEGTKQFKENSELIAKQRELPIQVIIGNPPYSAGQKSANDNAQNIEYPYLRSRIEDTYVYNSRSSLKMSLYDSYIQAFRWASDRIQSNSQGGVIGFITNGGWLDGNAASGFRKCLEEEFSSIYVFNLRGDQRTMGELSRREGGKIFGAGSRASVVITFLVRKPEHKGKAIIHYCDIGDYLKREEKLKILRDNKSVRSDKMQWKIIMPNKADDWIQQRSDLFGSFIIIGDKHNKNRKESFFTHIYSCGLKTSRDMWCYNSSTRKLDDRILQAITFYNVQCIILSRGGTVDLDKTKFNWGGEALQDAKNNVTYSYSNGRVRTALYRPFYLTNLYYSKELCQRLYQIPQLFPTDIHSNLVISVPGIGTKKDFSCLIARFIPDLGFNEACQCFPLYYYTQRQQVEQSLLDDEQPDPYERHSGITDWIHNHIKQILSEDSITKEDIFYYVYGILHSPDYRTKFNDDLKKSLPRIPIVEDVKDFQTFSTKGRELAELHLNYESVEPWEGVTITGVESNNFKVEKMRFPNKEDKSVIRYNEHILISNIPLEAYNYIVNGRSAIEWIMESYRVKTDKDSGIVNDPNDWAIEHKKPRYILDLLLSIITVSMKTLKLVSELPRLDFSEKPESEEDTGEHISHAKVHNFFNKENNEL